MKKNEAIHPKVLVLGDGLLGKEIIKQTDWEYLSRKKDKINAVKDFYYLISIIDDIAPDVIVNCIGYTNTYSKEKNLHWKINYVFVVNLANFCDSRDIKLVHISTDYLYANSEGGCTETDVPVHQQTWYAYTKLISDAYVQLSEYDYLLIRCGFKPTPFPYDKAFDNIRGNFDYVDVIAGQIIDLINENRDGVWNIGTEYKSVYELAKQTKPDIGQWHNNTLPTIEMDLTKFNSRNKQ